MRKQTILSFFLALLLIGPYVLTMISPKLEPYPAIILPSGAWTVSLKTDEISFPKYAIYGRRDHNEKWVALEPRQFLDPVPGWYLNGILSVNFGLEPTKRLSPALSANTTKKWFRDRLLAMEFKTDAFKVAVESVTLDRRSKNVVRREVRYEKIYVLD